MSLARAFAWGFFLGLPIYYYIETKERKRQMERASRSTIDVTRVNPPTPYTSGIESNQDRRY